MRKSVKSLPVIATSVLFVAAFVFFGVFLSGHIHAQEQFQLFLFTGSYFTNLVSAPGGFAVWLSRFLTQFYVSGLAGGLICAAAITGVQLLVARVAGKGNLTAYACSFIPAAALWVSLCREYSILNPAVSVILALSIAIAVASVKRSSLRNVLAVCAAPLVYWICGPAAITYAAALFGLGLIPAASVSVLLVLVSPLASRLLCRYNLFDLYFGYFYYKDPEIFPWLAWVFFAVLSLTLVSFVFLRKRPSVSGSLPVFCTIVLSAFVATGVGTYIFADFRLEEELRYSYLVRMQKWDRIIAKADKKSPLDKMSISCLNLALAQKGRLGDKMFKYIQCGVEGLIPPYNKVHTDNVFASDVYYYIGMPNASQRHIFESKEAIPDMQKGSRAYQRLAQTKSINRQFAASRKYLDALSNTLFYSSWARDFRDDSEELSTLRSWRYHKNDFTFQYNNMISQLGVLCEENPDNWMARQYLVCWVLLERDLKWLPKFFDMIGTENLPRHYQEAFLILFGERTGSLEGVPDFIDARYVSRFEKFLQLAQKNTPSDYLYKKYGDTYWFYYYFNLTKQ